jgi:hypothetical protein
VEKAISAIRAVVKSAKAQAASAAPLYLIIPPSATVMRTTIMPKLRAGGDGTQTFVVEGLGLAGSPFDADEQMQWSDLRVSTMDTNMKTYFDHIKELFDDLKNLKSWMRMRIHFGQLELLQFRKEFKMGYSWSNFVKMMHESRTKGLFEKRQALICRVRMAADANKLIVSAMP